MPYKARAGQGETWEVINVDTNDVKATHEAPDAKEKAERQVKLLNQIETHPEWDGEEE
jgi:hypothetical protein